MNKRCIHVFIVLVYASYALAFILAPAMNNWWLIVVPTWGHLGGLLAAHVKKPYAEYVAYPANPVGLYVYVDITYVYVGSWALLRAESVPHREEIGVASAIGLLGTLLCFRKFWILHSREPNPHTRHTLTPAP